ncbi:hypothetical protein D3C72_2491700 [compost metagenome]
MNHFFKVTPTVMGNQQVLDSLADTLKSIDGVISVQKDGGSAHVTANLDKKAFDKAITAAGLKVVFEEK